MLDRFMPRSRLRVLEVLLFHPGQHPLYLRELARASGVALQAAQRELSMLADIGLVRRMPRGREVYFHVEEMHPLVTPLRRLLGAALAAPRESPRREPLFEAPPASPAASNDSWRVW